MQPELGQNIRKARKEYGMNQTVLAERIGLSKTSLSLIESGITQDPGLSHIVAIADTLHMSLDVLVGREVASNGS